MPLPKFDPTINVGHILIIMSVAASVIFAYTDILRTTDDHARRIQAVENRAEQNTRTGVEILQTLSDIKSDLRVIKFQLDRDTQK